jgi:hypothetical protein
VFPGSIHSSGRMHGMSIELLDWQLRDLFALAGTPGSFEGIAAAINKDNGNYFSSKREESYHSQPPEIAGEQGAIRLCLVIRWTI